jgi:hypothetical protein
MEKMSRYSCMEMAARVCSALLLLLAAACTAPRANAALTAGPMPYVWLSDCYNFETCYYERVKRQEPLTYPYLNPTGNILCIVPVGENDTILDLDIVRNTYVRISVAHGGECTVKATNTLGCKRFEVAVYDDVTRNVTCFSPPQLSISVEVATVASLRDGTIAVHRLDYDCNFQRNAKNANAITAAATAAVTLGRASRCDPYPATGVRGGGGGDVQRHFDDNDNAPWVPSEPEGSLEDPRFCPCTVHGCENERFDEYCAVPYYDCPWFSCNTAGEWRWWGLWHQHLPTATAAASSLRVAPLVMVACFILSSYAAVAFA